MAEAETPLISPLHCMRQHSAGVNALDVTCGRVGADGHVRMTVVTGGDDQALTVSSVDLHASPGRGAVRMLRWINTCHELCHGSSLKGRTDHSCHQGLVRVLTD